MQITVFYETHFYHKNKDQKLTVMVIYSVSMHKLSLRVKALQIWKKKITNDNDIFGGHSLECNIL